MAIFQESISQKLLAADNEVNSSIAGLYFEPLCHLCQATQSLGSSIEKISKWNLISIESLGKVLQESEKSLDYIKLSI